MTDRVEQRIVGEMGKAARLCLAGLVFESTSVVASGEKGIWRTCCKNHFYF